MKTPDSISKKKQKLAQDLIVWQQREHGLRNGILLAQTPEEAERDKKKADFCGQEAARLKTQLNDLIRSTRTSRQIYAGWS